MAKLLCLMNNRNEAFPQKAVDALSYNKDWEFHCYKGGMVYMAALDLPFKNVSDYWLEDDRYVLMVDGEIMSWKDEPQDPSTAQKLLNLYRSKGPDMVDYLNGNFTLFIFDKREKSLWVANDRMGLRPLYYFEYNGKCCFSSEVKALLADEEFPGKCNLQSVLDLLTYEYVLEDLTLVENIFVFPYASTALIDSRTQKLVPQRYWDFNYQRVDQAELTDRYMEQYLGVFTQAVERTMKGTYAPVGLPLSGGLDSRLIAAVIDRRYFPLHTFTFGEKGCDDVKYAQKISRILGGSHHYIPIKHEELGSFFEKGVSYSDGMFTCLHYHYLNMTDELAAHVKIALDGMAGDVFPRRMYSYLEGTDVNAAFKAFDTFGENLRSRIFKKEYAGDLATARQRFDGLFDRVARACPVSPVDYLNITQRQRKFINYGKVGKRNYVEMRMPFLDYDFMDFCLTMPLDFRLNGKLVKNIFRKYYPALSRVPKADAGPLFPNRIQQAVHWRMQALKTKLGINSSYADYKKYFRTFLKGFIHGQLTSAEFRRVPYFDHQEVGQLLDEHFSGQQNYEKQIAALLTVAIWSKQYFKQ
ncbi:MAG: asparagine synthetase B [Candidatus Omnitrophota bacterium]